MPKKKSVKSGEIIATEDKLSLPDIQMPAKNASKSQKETYELLKSFRDAAFTVFGELQEVKSWDQLLSQMGVPTTSTDKLLRPQFKIDFTPARLRELYANHIWIFIAINAVARVIAGLPICVKQTKQETDEDGNLVMVTTKVDSHPFLDIINDPNPKIKDTKYQFIWRLCVEILATGKAYVWIRDFNKELDVVKREFLEPKLNKKGEIEHYAVTKQAEGYAVKTIPTDEIIDVRLPHPTNPLDGFTPIIAGILSVLISKYQDEFQVDFYNSGARKPGVLTNEGNTTIKQLMVVAKTYEGMIAGRGKGSKTVPLPKGVDLKELTISMQEQALPLLKAMSRDDVLAVFHVPPLEAGVLDHASYSNAAQMSRDFWEKTAIPFMQFLSDGFNTSKYFKPAMSKKAEKTKIAGERIFMEFDLSGVMALQVDESAKAKMIKEKDWLSVNEKRVEDGLKPFDGKQYDSMPWVEFIESIKSHPTPAEPVKFTLPGQGDNQEPNEAEAKLAQLIKDQTTARLSHLVETFTVDRQKRVKKYLKDIREVVINSLYEVIEGKRKGQQVKPYKKTDRYVEYSLLDDKAALKIFKTKWLQNPDLDLNIKTADELNEIMRLIFEDSEEFRRKYLDNYVKDLAPAYRIGFNESIIGTNISGLPDEELAEDVRNIGARQVSDFDESTMRSVRKTLSNKLAEGETTAKALAASIKDLFEITYRNRDITVAKHEIYSTLSGGEIKGQKTLHSLYPDATKTWVHGGNLDYREHHKAADGIKTVPINEMFVFNVEGKTEKLRSPRDPNASIGETINCGCYVKYNLGDPKPQ